VTADPGAAAPTIAWSSSDAAKASVGATSGIVTGVAPGAVAIKATATSGTSTGSGQASVTIVAVSAKVTGITVTPATVDVTPGQEVQASANVSCTNCNNTTDKAVTWSSLTPAIATVDVAGKIKGVAVGSAVVKATSNLDAGFSAAIAVTVVPAAALATVSIQSITQFATNLPVDLANVFEQIEVTLNLDRGGEKVTAVELLVDGQSIGVEQIFATPAASAEAVSPELAVETVVMSWNTAKFNAATGAVQTHNGEHTLSARVKTTTNTTGTASPSVKLTLDNSSMWATTIVVTNGSSANSAAGLQWLTGDLGVSAVPVIYEAGTQTINSATFSGCGVQARTLTASPYTASWPKAELIGDDGSAGIENANCNLSAASVVNNNPGPSGFSNSLRFDNKGPGAPRFMRNPNIRQNGWINASVGLVGLNTSATDNDWLVNGTADGGVGGYARYQRIAASPDGSVDGALAATASASPSLPLPSATNMSYCAIASARDLLGNESALPDAGDACTAPAVASSDLGSAATPHQLFGVDIAAPTVKFSGGLAANAQINGGTVAGEFQVSVTDTGTVGNSGMLSGSAVRGTVQIRNVTLTPPSGGSCFIGAFASGLCNVVSVNLAPPFPLVPTTTVAANTTVGYYTYTAFAQDAAGNQSAPLTKVVAFDPAANVPALTSALYNTPLSGGAVVFNANASDNFDLWKATYTLTFGGGLAGPVRLPDVILNTFNAATLQYSNVAAGITLPNFVRQVEAVTSIPTVALTTGGSFKPTSLTGFVTDQATNVSANAVTPIPGASVTTGVSYVAIADPTQQVRSWAVTNAAANISGGFPLTTPPNPLSVTINADVFGPTANFNPPFARVDFYVACQVLPGATCTVGQLYQVGTTTSLTTVDDGATYGRRHRYAFSWTPGTSFGAGAQALYAVGVNAAGDGLVTIVSNVITVTNP